MARAPQTSSGGRRRGLGVPTRGTGAGRIFTSKPVIVDFAGPDHRYARADLEIEGIFHGEASYEARIFLNNPKADENTPKTLDNGYAGSFHILGHGGCLGDPGHCAVNETKREVYDFRTPHPLTLAAKRVTVTSALRKVAETAKEITITVVPIVSAANELCDQQDVFRFKNMQFVTYNG